MQQNEIVDDGIDDDDLIKLEGAGIITQWTFPDQTKCPNKQCQIEFATRSHAIIHYKRQHAKNAILCELCSKPIATHTVNTFVNHYRQTHPFKKIPYGLDDEGAQSLGSQVWLLQFLKKHKFWTHSNWIYLKTCVG